MNRAQLDEQLVDYLYGELTPAERRAFEAAAAAHPDLIAQIEGHQATRRAMAALPAAPLPPALRASLLEAARAQVAPDRAASAVAPLEGFFTRLARRLMQPAFATAVAAVVILGVGLVLMQRAPMTPEDPNAQRVTVPFEKVAPGHLAGGAAAPEPASSKDAPALAAEPSDDGAQLYAATEKASDEHALEADAVPAGEETVTEVEGKEARREKAAPTAARSTPKAAGVTRSGAASTNTWDGVGQSAGGGGSSSRGEASGGKGDDVLRDGVLDAPARVEPDQATGGTLKKVSERPSRVPAADKPPAPSGAGEASGGPAPAEPPAPSAARTAGEPAPTPVVTPPSSPASDKSRARAPQPAAAPTTTTTDGDDAPSPQEAAETDRESVETISIRRAAEEERRKGDLDRLAELWKSYDEAVRARKYDEAEELLAQIARLAPESVRAKRARSELARRRDAGSGGASGPAKDAPAAPEKSQDYNNYD